VTAIRLTRPIHAAYSRLTRPHHICRKGRPMTNIFIMIFFGVALVIGIYFTWILLRNEMAGRPKRPDTYDFGFGPPQPDHKIRR
jgi:hypothetical protein